VVLAGTYSIVRRIGRGGMGEVYEARHARLAGRYAVKVLHAEVRKHPEAVARFQREAQITSALRHPGIVQVIDFDTAPNGLPFLVMEYLDGADLAHVIAREQPLSLARVVDITGQLASALTAAHRKGIVHRDLKPQNVFLLPADGDEPERVKILDFGVSKIRSVSRKITGTAVVLGTPQYMAPEQAEGHAEVDAAADQFSLAAIVYEMLTGQPPFAGDTLASLVYQIVHAIPTPVTGFRPELPNEVQHVVARGLSKNKDERFPSASDLALALKLSMHRLSRSGAEDAKTIVSPSAYLGFQAVRPPEDPAAAPSGVPAADDESPSQAVTTSERHSGELSRLRRVATSRPGLLVIGGAAWVALVVLVATLARSARSGRPPAAIAQRPRDPAGPTVQQLPSRTAQPAPPVAVEPPPRASDPPEAPVRPRARARGPETAPATPASTGGPRSPSLAGAGTELENPFESEGGAAKQPPPRFVARTCAMTIGSTPYAQLWVDHRNTGRYTPVVDFSVPCGDHQIAFKRPDLGIDRTYRISLTPGEPFRRRYPLDESQ
jgi:serine/threonine-protein kinase